MGRLQKKKNDTPEMKEVSLYTNSLQNYTLKIVFQHNLKHVYYVLAYITLFYFILINVNFDILSDEMIFAITP